MTSENDLRRALRRVEPPAGFAERTLARIEQAPVRDLEPSRRGGGWRGTGWIAAIAATVLLAIAVAEFTPRPDETDAQKAAGEVTLALRIAGEKLREVQVKVAAISEHEENRP